MMHSIVKEDLEYITSYSIPWEKLEGRNILVSGANGFLPAYMIETILFLNDHKFKKKAKVFALARNKGRVLERFSSYSRRSDLSYFIQDVCSPVKTTEKIDFIIHAASQASPKFYGVDPVGTILANTLGTASLLDLAVKHKSKGFLFFSSGEVYGEIGENNTPTKEGAYGFVNPVLIRSCYAEGKRAGENMCISWNYQFGVPAKIVRPFHTYGPGMRFDDGRVFADFVADIINGRDITLRSDGSAVRSFCYLADATVGFFTVLLNGACAQAYNVGNEEGEISVKDLANMLVDLFPERNLKVKLDLNIHQKGYLKSMIKRHCPDTGKLRDLGWKPYYPLREGFKRTVESFL